MTLSKTMARGASWGVRPDRSVRSRLTKLVAALAVGIAVVPAMGAAPAAAAAYDPATDGYSMKAMTQNTGVTTFWDQGYTGAGIDVAVIDTGVAPVEGLAAPGKIIYGPDLSLESQSPSFARLDTNGHGTFMAGLIAGKDSTLTAPYKNAPPSAYRGIAPDARIVSIKVATADGGVDVTQMIAAINWVIDHKTDNGMNIRVLNISYGTNSTQSSLIDPLSFAVERAWKAGIVVVAAAGNSGYQRGADAPGLANPAFNPSVIAVGGYDNKGTATTSDDVIGAYSASSSVRTDRKPDVIAVGSRLQGLRVPNSFLDSRHPEGLIGSRFFRGSGTSQAAAVTSGAVALLLQKYPSMPPDQVKRFMRSTADQVANVPANTQGKGALDFWSLANNVPSTSYAQSHTPSSGTGSVDAARGNDRLTRDGVVLAGEVDVFGQPFLPGAAGSTWSGGMWNGSTWSGSTWSGSTWSGSTWSGSSWSGSSWSGASWATGSWG
jgi:serine protease AprX